MPNVLSDDEELLNGLGSEIMKPSRQGNHMARTVKRWVNKERATTANLKNVNIDGVHGPVNTESYISPGQLYSTDSGNLFHAGRILVVLVGLPATSKTLLSVAITRYTRWLGVRTKSFHFSEYKESAKNIPSDYFCVVPTSKEGVAFVEKLRMQMLNDILAFFNDLSGQLAIYDALNIRKIDRKNLETTFSEIGVKVLFIESIVSDQEIMNRNIALALESNDYKGLSTDEAIDEYMRRLSVNEPYYEMMTHDEELSYIKYINLGKQIIVKDNIHGYLVNKIVFFLMNLRQKKGCVYFARCGTSDKDNYIHDEELNEEGIHYSQVLKDFVLQRIKQKRQAKKNSDSLVEVIDGSHDEDLKTSLIVWTGPRKRTHDTALFFSKEGIKVQQRSELRQLNPGSIADLTDQQIMDKFPSEYKESLKDPYHFRFPRAESYHDLAVRMEPLLLEMEHTSKDILIIAHESTLRVLYGYLMACTCVELPNLNFTRDKLVEISFSPFCNTVELLNIPLTS
ncbi:hypothetical protein H816_YJM1418L05177 [Saccharomyces cerevisiae YJM1418]|nr:hypothetical protein H816_YJM1418L05177 [Saccharomyces cerevisiae YJM1418]CAD6641344.1 HLJ1_G0030020.mRNA.1.CDS.1 [Saccharomyces cerevisiae]CAI4646800.1 CCN_G0037880.mRNA.1.CDS.1 [Saccharomyces cerevisiae]CAI7411931.1 CCN_G0037880.mRNA.1.CDS.1 [Saccharomyces cerevisiae]